MTLYTKSAIVTAGVITFFMLLCAFNYGRLTASQVTLRSSCDITAEQRAGLKANYYTIAWGR